MQIKRLHAQNLWVVDSPEAAAEEPKGCLGLSKTWLPPQESFPRPFSFILFSTFQILTPSIVGLFRSSSPPGNSFFFNFLFCSSCSRLFIKHLAERAEWVSFRTGKRDGMLAREPALRHLSVSDGIQIIINVYYSDLNIEVNANDFLVGSLKNTSIFWFLMKIWCRDLIK